ncbi:MAG: hypothetical protein NTZ97_03400 [Candidatus Moranbacteria bacterium]|nr:hypothetical protein [Candidatus Moranbacteria bacterium]
MRKIIALVLSAMFIVACGPREVHQRYKNVEIKKAVVYAESADPSAHRRMGFLVYPVEPLKLEVNGKEIKVEKFYCDYLGTGAGCNIFVIANPQISYIIEELHLFTGDRDVIHSQLFNVKIKK